VEAAYIVVEPVNYSLLFKCVCAKIGGEAKTKLLARTHVKNWEQAKAVPEENYSVRRTLDYYWIQCAETYRGQRGNVCRTSRSEMKNARAEVI